MNMKKRKLIDIHTHILPGVDDGSPNLATSLEMLEYAKALNIGTIVATPHLKSAKDADICRTVYAQFRGYAKKFGIRLLLGFEIHYRMLSNLERIPEYVFEGSNLILLELPQSALMPNWDAILYDLRDMGIRPIIAHPERYRYIQTDIEYAAQIRSFGCRLQVDARALTEFSFSAEHRCAQRLLREGYCDYIASDAHKPEHYRYFEKAYEKYEKVCRFELSYEGRQSSKRSTGL